MAITVRLRFLGPDGAEVVDQETLRQNAPRPFGFRPRPPAIPSSVRLSSDECDGLKAEEVRSRLAEKVVSLVRPHYPDAGAISVEWLDKED